MLSGKVQNTVTFTLQGGKRRKGGGDCETLLKYEKEPARLSCIVGRWERKIASLKEPIATGEGKIHKMMPRRVKKEREKDESEGGP